MNENEKWRRNKLELCGEDIQTSIQVSKNGEKCLRYELKPGNTGHRTNTTRVLTGKMFLVLWLLYYEGITAYIDVCPTAVGKITKAGKEVR